MINLVNEKYNFLFHKRAVELYLALNEINKKFHLSQVSKNYLITYTHIWKLIPKFIENELITIKKIGRCNQINYTEKGMKLYKELDELIINLIK